MHSRKVKLSPFKFRNGRGQIVKGVLLSPSDDSMRSPVGFCYLPGIVLGMAAVHRLGFDVGRSLAAKGHVFCLFDPAGVGESEGDYPAGRHPEVASWVLSGAFEQDTLEALDHVAAQTGVERFGLIGHCGGAVTSAYVGEKSHRVAGTFLISPPPCMDGENRVSAQAADQYFALYRRKVLSLDAWRRLLAGKTSYKTLVKVLMKKSRRAAQNRPTLFNQRLIRALGNIPAAQKLLWIVYGDRDPEYSDFQHFRMEHVPAQALTEIFANTSHGFLTEESLSKLLSSVDAFARLLTVRASADAMAISVVN